MRRKEIKDTVRTLSLMVLLYPCNRTKTERQEVVKVADVMGLCRASDTRGDREGRQRIDQIRKGFGNHWRGMLWWGGVGRILRCDL